MHDCSLEYRMAGSDNVAGLIRMTLLFLINNPAAYRKLREEIDQRCGVEDDSFPIKHTDAKSMPYLQAVIRESLRVFPPVPGSLHKRVPKGGATICGYSVPEGTQVGHNLYSIATSREIWGDDAEVFRPGRWFEFDEPRLREMRGIVDLCFGHGRYECLGKTIGLMETSKVLVEVRDTVCSLTAVMYVSLTISKVVRRYDLTVVQPLVPIKLTCTGFYVASDFWVKVQRRS
jgi:cytochrome P450